MFLHVISHFSCNLLPSILLLHTGMVFL
uniref:Uncharacterized protein n=1 Tax=Arundo donax TaxID=35708 RepID=A0A0A9EM53_ARUDO